MEQVFLTSLPLNYADSIRFEHNGQFSKVVMVNEEQNLLIMFCGIINFSALSNGSSDGEDYLDFIDIQHEYRKIRSDEFQKDNFFSCNTVPDNPVHIISIHGNVALRLICETVEVHSTNK
jgi:hypothetical protein